MFEIKHYLTDNGSDVFADWRDKVKDTKTQIAIDRRIYRAELGNFGDHKPCREGVWELRLDIGPGYRVYYAQDGKTVILLLGGGVKRSQGADITQACEYWHDWQRRKEEERNERSTP
ncbi:addiction module killer protein [Betaproteobacteria bacterium]|nr:addiction module killer protein [Betaproteobacteria bacterium]GHU22175.1 addiction module killer protein [Betaproteobacteria bacterium]GHU23688.1 addiction module killer protein [Betaproteobacteria bacterium]